MSDRTNVPVIGLVGGVGCGKSTLAHWVARDVGIELIDGDRIGHDVLTHPEVRRSIHARFGTSVFDSQGGINRTALAAEVFGPTADRKRARGDLEKIVHPRIREGIRQRIDEAGTSPAVRAVILDAAVLLEAGWDEFCDAVVFVDAPYPERRRRTQQHRGWTSETLEAREASQWPLDKKRAAADYVIDNSGSIEEAGRALTEILRQLAPRGSFESRRSD